MLPTIAKVFFTLGDAIVELSTEKIISKKGYMQNMTKNRWERLKNN